VLADCVAAPGFFGNVNGGFQPCPAGSFTPTTGMTVCDSCPAGATSPAAATSQIECNCSLVGWRERPRRGPSELRTRRAKLVFGRGIPKKTYHGLCVGDIHLASEVGAPIGHQ